MKRYNIALLANHPEAYRLREKVSHIRGLTDGREA